MKVVEVLSVEPSEGDHAATHEPSTVSTTGFRVVLHIATDLDSLEGIGLHVDHQQIVEIVAEPACEHIDFVIVDDTGVSPAGEEGRTLQLAFHPS